jgi:tetratricopeptide (TPR) repeat protein
MRTQFHISKFKPALAGALAVFLSLACSAMGENASPGFEAANRLYFEGKFAEAATTYGMLAQSGQRSAALYYNWGNALFKSGQIGRAIAAYRQAESLNPRDPDIRANLQFARKQTQGPALAASRPERWLERLTLNEWSILAAVSVWAFFLVLALRQLRPVPKGLVAILAAAMALLCACTAAAYGVRLNEIAIVVAADAVVRHGPLDESQNAFVVHDGAELRVLDRKDDWLQVSADPQRIGWLRQEQVIQSRDFVNGAGSKRIGGMR